MGANQVGRHLVGEQCGHLKRCGEAGQRHTGLSHVWGLQASWLGWNIKWEAKARPWRARHYLVLKRTQALPCRGEEANGKSKAEERDGGFRRSHALLVVRLREGFTVRWIQFQTSALPLLP